ncbi:MAG TPA: hypothetical protein VII73_10850 [Caulobacteraceae bacterium]
MSGERGIEPGRTAAPTTVDAYIAAFAPEIQAILREIRVTIQRAAPEATERISYNLR